MPQSLTGGVKQDEKHAVTAWKNEQTFLWCKKNNISMFAYIKKSHFGQDSKDSNVNLSYFVYSYSPAIQKGLLKSS